MGNFYTNVTLKGPTQDAITRTISQQSRWALISPSFGDLTVVFDLKGEAQDGSIFELAERLSREHQCIAFAVMNHDDSVLYYRLYDRGDTLDEYISSPNYFDGPPVGPSGGNARLLCQVFGALDKCDLVNDILRHDSLADESDKRYIWEVDRHRELADTLNIPGIAVGTGYSHLAENQFPEGLDIDDCHVIEGEENA